MWQAIRRWAPLVLIAITLYLLTVLGKEGVPEVGKSLGEVKTELIDGRVWELDDDKGDVVVVNFWATWCGPCRQEAKVLNRVHRQGVKVVGLAIDGLPAQELKQKATDIGIDYPIGNAEPALLSRLGLKVIPTTCVVGKDGRVSHARTGVMSEAELSAAVAEARR
jgi:thiol-disulfide isomerase/thioredoxin